jgi:hypothetical protein
MDARHSVRVTTGFTVIRLPSSGAISDRPLVIGPPDA